MHTRSAFAYATHPCTFLQDARFARAQEAVTFLREVEPGMTALTEKVNSAYLRAEMKHKLQVTIDYCERGGLGRALSGGATKAQEVLERMQNDIKEFKGQYGENPIGLEILKPYARRLHYCIYMQQSHTQTHTLHKIHKHTTRSSPRVQH